MAQGKPATAIIGGGVMGGDIAVIFAAGGWDVHVMSPSQKTRDALPPLQSRQPRRARRDGFRCGPA